MSSKNSNKLNIPEAKAAMNKFKMEAASEVGVNLKQGYNGDLTSREAGSVGGQMVKKMIESYEKNLQKRLFRKSQTKGAANRPCPFCCDGRNDRRYSAKPSGTLAPRGNIFHSRAEETKGQGTCRPWCSFCAIYLQKYLIAFSADLI